LNDKRYLNYSISKFLRSNNKSSDEFEFMLNQLTLEEIIALKFELASKTLNGKFYGFNIWNNIPRIVKEGLLLFAISATTNMVEAQTLLGISDSEKFRKVVYRYRESLRYYKVLELPKRNYAKFLIKDRTKKEKNNSDQ